MRRGVLQGLPGRFVASCALLALLWSAPALAQSSAQFMYKHTLADAVNYVYGVMTGIQSSAWSGGNTGPSNLTTSGSSTTVTCLVAGCFRDLLLGDTVIFSLDGGNTYTPYRITTRTSSDAVVVDTAVNIGATGIAWKWWKETRGTTAASGWIPVKEGDLLTFEYNSGTGDAIVSWECRTSAFGASPIQVYPDNSAGAATKTYAASGIDARKSVVVLKGYTFCRIGVKGTSPVVTAYVSR